MREQYTIHFAGLEQESYRYDYLIEDAFFTFFECSPVRQARVWVNVELTKAVGMTVLDFIIKGTVLMPCDRCLEEFDLNIAGTNRLIVKFGEKFSDEDPDMVILSRKEPVINIAQYIYEFINLLIPARIIHPDDEDGNNGCNPDVIKTLKKHLLKNNGSKKTDPRWEKLKDLYDKE